MSKKASDLLVWVDCEFTGLDIDKDEMVEIGIVVTDYNLTPLDEGIDLLIKPSDKALNQMSDFVRKMHTSSGLINELETALSLQDAEAESVDYVKRFIDEPGKALLAGNSIWSDKKFLSKYMPDFIALLHYRMIDVSTIKMLAKKWYPKEYKNAPEKAGGHRALQDILESIKELEYYRDTIFKGASSNPMKNMLS
jgi:oligoribonuclease